MARVRALLALSRRSDRRVSETTRSGTEKLFEIGIAAGASFALLQQLRAIAVGPLDHRVKAGHLVALVLCALWAVIPLSIRPTIPVQALSLYPLTTAQQLLFHVLSYLQNRRLLALLAASFAVLVTIARVPEPIFHMAQATAALAISSLLGLALATLLRSFAHGNSSSGLSRRTQTSWPLPLLRKEFRYFSRTLDLWVALVISLAAGYSEYLAAWMTPAKASLPLLLLALMQLPLVLNPYGLDAPYERERYQLLPIPARRILFLKHVALATLFLAASIPLAGSLFYRMPLKESSIAVWLFLVVLLSWLCTGILLMRLPAARTVRMAFGTLSGDGMSIVLSLQAAALLLSLPILLGILFVGAGANGLAITAPLALPFLVLIYVWALRLADRPN